MRPRGQVLVVDDLPVIRHLLCDLLSEEGYAVAQAGDGAEALDVLARMGPDGPGVILTDGVMPVMDGAAVLRAYRALPGPHAPAVAMCASNLPVERETQALADATINKPFEFDALLALVARYTATEASGDRA